MPVVTIIRGEAYTDAHPLGLTIEDADGVAVDLTGCSFQTYVKDKQATVLTVTGSTQGSSWDSPTAGKCHPNMSATQTASLAESTGLDEGWIQCEILFSDGAIRDTDEEKCAIKSPLA